MRRIRLIVLFSFLFTAALFAQDEGDKKAPVKEPEIKSPEGVYLYQPIRKEDKFIRLGLALNSPLFNTSRTKFAIKTNIYPGGSIYLGFAYYVTNGFSLGATLSFDFYLTLGTNLYFAVPFTFDMIYTFTYGKWRFPLGIGIGGDFQAYNGIKYFGMIFRPETGFYYQYSPEWSFGAGASWNIVPQWYSNTSNNRIGNILGISFAARYHF